MKNKKKSLYIFLSPDLFYTSNYLNGVALGAEISIGKIYF